MWIRAFTGALLVSLFLALVGLCLGSARARPASVPIGMEVGTLTSLLTA